LCGRHRCAADARAQGGCSFAPALLKKPGIIAAAKGGQRMTKTPERRRDNELRKTIDEYRRLAAAAVQEAANAADAAKRENHLAMAQKWTELADTLQGRPSD
jgi:hypothetical protein